MVLERSNLNNTSTFIVFFGGGGGTECMHSTMDSLFQIRVTAAIHGRCPAMNNWWKNLFGNYFEINKRSKTLQNDSFDLNRFTFLQLRTWFIYHYLFSNEHPNWRVVPCNLHHALPISLLMQSIRTYMPIIIATSIAINVNWMLLRILLTATWYAVCMDHNQCMA